MTPEHPEIDPLAPWPTLQERDSGQLPERQLYEDVPAHLDEPLRRWVADAVHDHDFATRVLLRMRVSSTLGERVNGKHVPALAIKVLTNVAHGELSEIQLERPVDRLSVVNAIIGLHPDWPSDWSYSGEVPSDLWEWGRLVRPPWGPQLGRLAQLLEDAGSAWEVNPAIKGLARRVDPTATRAWQSARAAAEAANRRLASQHLARAWELVYGMRPDPSAGYSAAVKAVEAAALPVVLPDKSDATVHQVRTELKKRRQRWRFTLVENETVPVGEGSIDVVAEMMERFLRGETERHANETRNRPSEQQEAEAALHLAVVLVQWFVTGAIQPRSER